MTRGKNDLNIHDDGEFDDSWLDNDSFDPDKDFQKRDNESDEIFDYPEASEKDYADNIIYDDPDGVIEEFVEEEKPSNKLVIGSIIVSLLTLATIGTLWFNMKNDNEAEVAADPTTSVSPTTSENPEQTEEEKRRIAELESELQRSEEDLNKAISDVESLQEANRTIADQYRESRIREQTDEQAADLNEQYRLQQERLEEQRRILQEQADQRNNQPAPVATQPAPAPAPQPAPSPAPAPAPSPTQDNTTETPSESEQPTETEVNQDDFLDFLRGF